MNDPIIVDVGWYRLAVDPEGVMINMNLKDFKKMLRICCNVIPEHSDKLKYLDAWYTFLSLRTDYDPIKRRRMKDAINEREGKV